MGSSDLTFVPGAVRPGDFIFDIGTAGSTSLVLQTVALPLSQAGDGSEVTLIGGTHVPWSPCTHFLDLQWLPILRRMGFAAEIDLRLAGFYPQGGGRISCVIRPAYDIQPLNLVQRGDLVRLSGISAVADLDQSIADRQKRQALGRLSKRFPSFLVKTSVLPARSKGTFLLILAEYVVGRGCFTALGERGKPAERVADECVDALEAFLTTEAVVDHFMADQLLIPLALALTPSQIYTSQVTRHLLTNAEVICSFLKAQIDVQGELGKPGQVKITPLKPSSA